MKISRLNLDSNISKIIEDEKPENWVTAIDNHDKSGKKLIRLLKALAESGSHSRETCAIVDQAIKKISVKKLTPELQIKFKKAADKATRIGSTIVKPIEKSYTPEVVGISKKAIGGKSKKTVHVYKDVIGKRFDRWRDSGTKKDFEQWLEDYAKSHEKKKMQKNCVKYLSEDEAKKYLVSFDNKKLKQEGHTVKDGYYIYVLDAKMKSLFLGKKVKGEFHHSSFTGGTPVACAGGMKIKNGKIKEIDLHSGHYKPTKQQGENLLKFLSKSAHLGTKAERFTL